jgi:hypothetical protein
MRIFSLDPDLTLNLNSDVLGLGKILASIINGPDSLMMEPSTAV